MFNFLFLNSNLSLPIDISCVSSNCLNLKMNLQSLVLFFQFFWSQKMCLDMLFRFVTPSNDLPPSPEAKSKRFVFIFLNTFAFFFDFFFLILINYNLDSYKFQQTKCAVLLFNSLTEVLAMDSPRRDALGDAHFYCSTGSSLMSFFVVYDYYHYKSSKPNTKVPKIWFNNSLNKLI